MDQASPSRHSAPCISLVMHGHNEAAGLETFFARVLPALEAASEKYEILCVDDGSKDNTFARLVELSHSIKSLRLIQLSRNFGKEAAMTAGIDAASGDVVIPIDADLQDPPELISTFVDKWRAGADVVVGVRSDRSTDGVFKRWTAVRFYRLFNQMSDVKIIENAGDFRLMDRRVVEVLKRLPERARFMKGLFAWAGFKTELVEFEREPRAVGEGKWKTWKLWNFALDGIFSFSTLPLRVWTYIGAGFAFACVLYMATIIARVMIYGVDVPGYASLVVVMLFSVSMNLIGIGILGEYIGRIFHEVKGRPIYVVDRELSANEEAPTRADQTTSEPNKSKIRKQ